MSLAQTSFYGDGDQERLRGPRGEPGKEGKQGPAGPLVPLPTYPTNDAAKTAGLPLGTLYMRADGQVFGVI